MVSPASRDTDVKLPDLTLQSNLCPLRLAAYSSTMPPKGLGATPQPLNPIREGQAQAAFNCPLSTVFQLSDKTTDLLSSS